MEPANPLFTLRSLGAGGPPSLFDRRSIARGDKATVAKTRWVAKKPSIYSYNGCDPEAFYPIDMLTCRTSLGLNPVLNYYLFIGSLSKWRGVDLLINIFKNGMSENEILFILGNSSHAYGAELKSFAAGAANIIFHDEVDSSLVVKYINAADVCLVPVKPILKSLGNPLKLYDYIACGKPVIGQGKCNWMFR